MRVGCCKWNFVNRLERLVVSRNNLSLLEPGAFEQLNNVQHLSLAHNQLTTISKCSMILWSSSTDTSEADTLRGLGKLITLNLEHNNIRHIDPRAFEHTPDLQVRWFRVTRVKARCRCSTSVAINSTLSVYHPAACRSWANCCYITTTFVRWRALKYRHHCYHLNIFL